MKTLDLDVLILMSIFSIMHNNNTNYINGDGCIFTRSHPTIHYGQTGKYWTDATAPKGYAWFAESLDNDFAAPAVLVKIKNIFTKDSSYINGVQML